MTKIDRILDETTLEPPYFRVTGLPDSIEAITERVEHGTKGVVRVINDDEIEIRRRQDLSDRDRQIWGITTPQAIRIMVEGHGPNVLLLQFRPDPATGGLHVRSNRPGIDLRRLKEYGIEAMPQPHPDPFGDSSFGMHYLLYARVGNRLPSPKHITALLGTHARLESTEDPGDDPVVIQIG